MSSLLTIEEELKYLYSKLEDHLPITVGDYMDMSGEFPLCAKILHGLMIERSMLNGELDQREIE